LRGTTTLGRDSDNDIVIDELTVSRCHVVLLDAFLCRLRTRWLRYMTPQPFSAEVVPAEAARMVAGSVGSYVTLIVTESYAKPPQACQVVPNRVLRNTPGNGCGSVGGMMHVYTGAGLQHASTDARYGQPSPTRTLDT
jgi:hypothetical protein